MCLSRERRGGLHGQEGGVSNPYVILASVQIGNDGWQDRRGDGGFQRREEADEREDKQDNPEPRPPLELRRAFFRGRILAIDRSFFGLESRSRRVLLCHGD